MLFKGPLFADKRFGRELGGAVLNSGKEVTWSGVDGADSPSTAVLGRKREAITTLWFLSELIVPDDDELRGRRGMKKDKTSRAK